jgi:acetylglutamate kinase
MTNENADERYIVVLKVGGNELDDPTFLFGLTKAVQAVLAEGHFPVIVHGGGKAITDLQARLGWRSSASKGCASPTTPAWTWPRWC